MYGQTNCWLRPDMNYIAFETKSKEIFICTYRAALNMSYQKMTAQVGKVDILATMKGEVSRTENIIISAVKTFPVFIFPANSGSSFEVSLG